MKKILFLIFALTLSYSAAAKDCPDGTVIKAHNGMELCRSTEKLRWEQARSWCAARKMKLVSWEEVCPGSYYGKHCDNLDGIGEDYIWTSTKVGDQFAFRISLSCGCTNRNAHHKSFTALCQ